MLTLTLLHILVVISFFFCFIIFVFVTRGRRPLSNILAWLFFMFLMPYIGIPLFLIVGQRKLDWVLRKKRQHYEANCTGRSCQISAVEVLLNTFGVLPPSENNQVTLLTDGVMAYNTLMQQIKQAQHSIFICTYRLTKDTVGQAIVEQLIIKAQQGVQVCLLLDTIGSFGTYPRRDLKPLRKAGASVRYIMPLFHTPFRGRANLRDHRKIMLFDGKYAITGGMNLAEEYMGPTALAERWVDICALIEGTTVNELLSVFESDWIFAASNMEQKSYNRPRCATEFTGTSVIQTVPSGPDTIGDQLYDAVISSVYAAQESIYIVTPYFILDDALQKAFMLAIRRGVDVNIIVPRKSNHPLPDLVRSISLRKLRHEGATIWLAPKMVHAKLMVFDNTVAVIGSANLDLRSLLLNFEISCFMYSEKDIQAIKAWISDLQADCSTEFKKPSLRRMLIEDAAQLVKPLL